MLLNSLQDLAPAPNRAVIINVGTKWVSTLALLSALKYAGMPVLVVDCEYGEGDGSLEHFRGLMRTRGFDLLSAPLKKHGFTLDWLFRNIPDEKVLLVDSDLEILGPEIVRVMKDFIDEKNVFGSGFVHGPCWLHDHPGIGYYQERMWIPLTFLRTAAVRQALEAGLSFGDATLPNEFAPSRLVSRILLSLHMRIPFLRNNALSWLKPFRGNFYGLSPAYVYCDTGANVFQYLKYRRGMSFAGFPAELHEKYAAHFHGITRRVLNAADLNASALDASMAKILERLKTEYGVDPWAEAS